MKSTDKFVLVLVASLALLLAGCGGGSSTPAEPSGPTAEEMAAERMAAQRTALETANSAVSAALTNLVGATPTQTQIDAANTAIGNLQTALNDAADLSDADKAPYRTALTNAMASVTRAERALQVAQDAAQEEADKATRAMARKLFNGLAQTGEPAADATAAETANRALRAGRFVSQSSTGVMVDSNADGTDPAPITVKKSSTAVSGLGGWAGSDYVRKMSGTTDHVVLYSNRGTKSEKFSEKHASIITAGTGDDLGTFSILDGVLTTAANLRYIKGGDFSTVGTKPHTEDDGDKASIDGTFDGVSGKYSCTQASGTTCTSMINGDGNIVLVGGWTFVPSSLDALTQTPDSAYLVYGWWSRETSDGVDVASIAATQGTVESGNTAANGINGTATYKGGAAGKYSVYNPLGDNSNAGAFTANATLTANFTDKKISGELTDFMSGGESMDWMVSLNAGDAANIDGSGIGNSVGTTADNVTTTWTMGETSDDPRGTWSGNFYKSNGAEAADESAQAPAAVTGAFTAMHNVGGLNIGQMAGAFGADLEE